MRRWLRMLIAVALLALVGVAGTLVFIYSGVYDVAATRQHNAPTYWVLMKTLHRSIERHAAAEAPEPPSDLADPRRIQLGLALYEQNCLPCHGAPGVAREPLGRSMTPLPPNLAAIARTSTAREIYWSVRYGLKMTGMPAWEFRMPEQELWSVVAFVEALEFLSVPQYRELRAQVVGPPQTPSPAARAAEPTRGVTAAPLAGDPDRGRIAIRQHACPTCHVIPGITGADQLVGPPLIGIARRGYIGGVLPNTPENLIAWLMNPPLYEPDAAMPDLGVSENDARDIAAFLYTIR